MSPVSSLPLPEPSRFIRDDDVPAQPLRVNLRTSLAATHDDIHAVIAHRRGVVREISAAGRTRQALVWRIAFHPPTFTDAAETMVGLLDLGQLSFALPSRERPAP
jgi:hypothetical protein